MDRSDRGCSAHTIFKEGIVKEGITSDMVKGVVEFEVDVQLYPRDLIACDAS